jgi:HxlR-like helix-turn-helix
MERDRLIDRKVYPIVPPMVEYSLTPMGRLFIEPIEMLYAWAAKNDDVIASARTRPLTEAGLRLRLVAVAGCHGAVEPFGLLREREPIAGQLLIRASYVRVAGLGRAAIGGVRSLSIIIGSR